MIAFYPTQTPSPYGVRVVYPTNYTTGVATFISETGSSEVYWNLVAYEDQRPLTDIEKAIEALRARAALVRLWSRLALAELQRMARRLRPRAPVGQYTPTLFARRTCSISSRWMVLQ